jgi:uncharacterized protein YndB with AHSA1/START domain
MSTRAADTSVQTAIVVDAPVQRAFDAFTDEMARWWHPDHHLLEGPVAEMVFEPRVGGHVYDRGADGRECRWARVLAYEPPHRVVFSWDINTRWELETDPEKSSEVEVRFVPEDAGRTRVELEHRHLDRHGDGWEDMRGAVGASDGWPDGLRRFADHLAA